MNNFAYLHAMTILFRSHARVPASLVQHWSRARDAVASAASLQDAHTVLANLRAENGEALSCSRAGTFQTFRCIERVYIPVREHIVDFHSQEAKIFPYGNVSEWDEGYEIHTTGHRQAGPRDPEGAGRDAKGARPDLRHGSAIHHRARKRERDRRNR
jgi:hypothetical protein